MKRQSKQVCYSYEHGDQSLPKLEDLVSDIADPEKSLIISYLNTHCILACSGIRYDEITPGKVIGAGNVFSDGTYIWDDALINYVERYNIPLPKEFREHILQNYLVRTKRHTLLRLVDKLEIENNPYLGYKFRAIIFRHGVVQYWNNIENKKCITTIKSDDAAYIIGPIMTEIFCYDSDSHGKPAVDGYHWKLTFYKKDIVIDTVEGWPNEDGWRYNEFKNCLELVERFIPFDMGYKYMNLNQNCCP